MVDLRILMADALRGVRIWLGGVPDVYWSILLWVILLIIIAYRTKKDEGR